MGTGALPILLFSISARILTMNDEFSELKRPLRKGFTTGACATAASLAAATRLLKNISLEDVTIRLPQGQSVTFKLHFNRSISDGVEVGVVKDAGDDPDVTHGAVICSQVTLTPTPGCVFCAGFGVGTVTRAGLPVAIGEPAINPVPRLMIQSHLQSLADDCAYKGGFDVTIGVENGDVLAKKTLNERLGIIGGLSILGTTGIVRPFSCSAYIASIHQAIDVAIANGIEHIAACTGSTSERATQAFYELPDMALIEMGDIVGAVLKYLNRHPIPQLTLACGFGKLTKLAQGEMNLHSNTSRIDFSFLASLASDAGANAILVNQLRQANTGLEALEIAQQHKLPLADLVCNTALTVVRSRLKTNTQVDIVAVDRQGNIVGQAPK